MLKNDKFRVLLGILFGATGGASMTVAVFPYATILFISTPTFNLLDVTGLLFPIIVLWMLGGGLVGWFATPQMGVLWLGGCGLLSGLFLGVYGTGDIATMLIGTITGAIYGAFGGVIIGYAMANLTQEKQ